MSALENMLQELKAPQTGARPRVLPMWEFVTFLTVIVFIGCVLWWEIAAHV